jgi:iron(III) transport system ATP-binding protein
VLVTHDQQEALGAADVVAVLRDGRVVQAAPPRTLYAEPADLAVGTFVGEAVVLPATARGGRADTALGPLPVVGPDGTGQVLLRPEQLVLTPPGRVVATVADVVFHGHDTTVLLTLDGSGHLLRCRTPDPDAAEVGERVGVSVRGAGRFYPGP